MKKIPDTTPAYDLTDSRFWDEKDLRSEVERVFHLCSECRLCVKFCGSFPKLLGRHRLVLHGGGVRGKWIPQAQAGGRGRGGGPLLPVQALHINCPYTPRGPRLGHRLPAPHGARQAQHVKKHGVSLTDRVLGSPDLVGKLGSATAPWPTGATRTGCTGCSCRAPSASTRTRSCAVCLEDLRFPVPLRAPGARGRAGGQGRLLRHLFRSTTTNPASGWTPWRSWPGTGWTWPWHTRSAAACRPGTPATWKGQGPGATERRVPDAVRGRGPDHRRHQPHVLADPARRVPPSPGDPGRPGGGRAHHRPHAFLASLHAEGKLNRDFKTGPGRIAYHQPCHLRAQRVGNKTSALLSLLPDTEVTTIQACSGHGTWAMKRENFEASMRWGRQAFRGIEEAEAEVACSDCPLAAIQIEQATGQASAEPAGDPAQELSRGRQLGFVSCRLY